MFFFVIPVLSQNGQSGPMYVEYGNPAVAMSCENIGAVKCAARWAEGTGSYIYVIVARLVVVKDVRMK